MSTVLSLAACLALHLCLAALAGGVEVFSTVSPMSNTSIPYVSPDEVVYSCQIEGDPDYTVLWELSGLQIFSNLTGITVVDSEAGRNSILTVTQQGREVIDQNPISVECRPSKLRSSTDGKFIYYINQFGPPGKVGGLELTYHSEQELRLQWSRPGDFPSDVLITYHINITNTSSGAVTQSYEITETYVLVSQTGEGDCQPHLFSVTASNDAGTSPASTIMESIPISLDIGPVASSQMVDQLLLVGSTANITLSFQPAPYCSAQFPVLNYTASIVGLEGSVVVAEPPSSASLISLTLSSSDIPALRVGQLYSIVITACTDFTCRSPAHPLVSATTGVQAASVVFYSTAVSLNCSFAAGSSASGCLFVFQLTNQNLSENVTVPYTADVVMMFNTSCNQLSNTRGAYDEEVLVYAVQSDGSTDSQPLTASVLVETEPDNFTCPLPSVGGGDGGISAGAIAGVVVASLLAALFFGLFVCALAFVCYLRTYVSARNTRRVEQQKQALTWSEGLKVFIDDKILGREATDMSDPIIPEVEEFPVVALAHDAEHKAVTVQMLDCQNDTRAAAWLRDWVGGQYKYVELYPHVQKRKKM